MAIHHPKTPKGRKALQHPPFQWKIYKGDVVGVNRGPFKGIVGEVIRTHKRYHELQVKGVNLVRRKAWDYKTDPSNPTRVWVEREEPIHYSRVQLVDPVTQELTKVDWRYLESGERVRIARKSGYVVPRPILSRPDRPPAAPSPFDTPAEAVHEVTYTPRGIPDYVADMPAGATPRYERYPERMKSLRKEQRRKAKVGLSYKERQHKVFLQNLERRQQARARRHLLPEVLQHLHGTPRPPAVSYLARVAAAEAAAAQAGGGAVAAGGAAPAA